MTNDSAVRIEQLESGKWAVRIGPTVIDSEHEDRESAAAHERHVIAIMLRTRADRLLRALALLPDKPVPPEFIADQIRLIKAALAEIERRWAKSVRFPNHRRRSNESRPPDRAWPPRAC